VRPVRLGAELNRAENRHVRHRMFAIVDRTNLSTYNDVTSGNTNFYTNVTLQDPTKPSPQLGTFGLTGPTSGVDPRTGRPWQIQARWPGLPTPPNPPTPSTQRGTLLVIDAFDTSGNEETVEVLTIDAAGNMTAIFSNPNHQGFGNVIIRGNPGPWLRYDPRQDAAVVPYFSIID
jgi:hypothetical protein